MAGVGAGEKHKSSRTFQMEEGVISREKASCISFLHTANVAHSPGQPGRIAEISSPVTVGALPTQSRLLWQPHAWCPVSAGEGVVRQACVYSSFPQALTLPLLPHLSGFEGRLGKALPFSWGLHS